MEFYDPIEGVWTDSEDMMGRFNEENRVDLDVDNIPDSDTREDDLVKIINLEMEIF